MSSVLCLGGFETKKDVASLIDYFSGSLFLQMRTLYFKVYNLKFSQKSDIVTNLFLVNAHLIKFQVPNGLISFYYKRTMLPISLTLFKYGLISITWFWLGLEAKQRKLDFVAL